MGYCQEDPARNQCFLCPIMILYQYKQRDSHIRDRDLKSPRDQEIFQRFKQQYGGDFIRLIPEYCLGRKRADAVGIRKDGKCWVFEIEKKLNYTAIGQALTYKRLYRDIYKKIPEAVIVCEKSDVTLEKACKMDAGIQVILV